MSPLAAIALLLAAPSASASGPPLDAYGRPLADACGPLRYRAGDARRTVGAAAEASRPDAAPGRPGSAFALGPYASTHPGSWPDALAIGDVTGDGRRDVVLTTTSRSDPANDYSVFLYPQLANGTLGPPGRHPYAGNAFRNGIALADLDEDGVLDVVVGHGGGVSVLLADGAGGLRPAVVWSGSESADLAAMDVDLDGHVDVAAHGWSPGGMVFHGDGTGALPRTSRYVDDAQGYNDLEAEDVTGDGVPDLVAMANQVVGEDLFVHRHDGVQGLLAPPDTYGVPEVAEGVGLGDVTGDGRHDAVLSERGNRPVALQVFAQDASGRLAAPTAVPTFDVPGPVVVTDIDGDGREDVTVAHAGWERVGVYLQQPGGGLGAELLFPIPYASVYNSQGLDVGDFSSDGCPDVAIADYNNGLVVLYGQGCASACPLTLGAVSEVRAVKAPTADDVHLEWAALGGASDGYNVWRVADKREIAEAHAAGSGVAASVCRPAPATSCDAPGDVSDPSSPRFFYQVRGVCGGNEGL